MRNTIARAVWPAVILAVLWSGTAIGAGAAAPAAASPALRLTAAQVVTLATPQKETAVRLALADLARDVEWVLGTRPALADGAAGTVVVRTDAAAVPGPERYRIDITPGGVVITGSDTLGTLYGIYHFSEAFLGVDPYWFWKDWRPARREAVDLPPQTIESRPFTFRYRGWFVNDEDLLTEWKESSGPRHIDYPFYAQVINLEVADRIFETLLRARGNLVIPASFIDVMNPPEAALVARAAARGLYVTQHHIEPMGVSYFSFGNYWQNQGRKVAFSYGAEPDRVRQTWTAYARKWRELAGDQVVWQLGLRGKGDQPVWGSDKAVTQADAGKFISRAIQDQWDIVRSVDPRPHPPATTTLWAEGSALMSRGALALPKGITIVFADEGATQTMQADFRDLPRSPDNTYGVYYHIAYWMNGPHLVQGSRPAKIRRNFDAIVAKGDTQYAIINVSNVREHLLGIEAAMGQMRAHGDWSEDRFLEGYAGPLLAPLYREFLAALLDTGGEKVLQDGTCYGMAKNLVAMLAAEKKGPPAGLSPRASGLAGAVARLDQVIAEFPADRIPPPQREFYTANLLVQAQLLRGLYECTRQLELALDDRNHLAQAEAALADALKARERAALGSWANWYRGDKKENLPALLARIRTLKRN
jgi:hypothetical protein